MRKQPRLIDPMHYFLGDSVSLAAYEEIVRRNAFLEAQNRKLVNALRAVRKKLDESDGPIVTTLN